MPPPWQDLRAMYPKSPDCTLKRIHGAKILPSSARKACISRRYCQGGGLFRAFGEKGMHTARFLPTRAPLPPQREGRGHGRRCSGRNADGAQQARAEERCRNRGAHGSVGPMVSCGAVPAVRRGPGFSRDCRSARAACGGRAARQACRHGPELCRRDARGHRAGTRLAWGGDAGRTIRSNAQASLQRAPSELR